MTTLEKRVVNLSANHPLNPNLRYIKLLLENFDCKDLFILIRANRIHYGFPSGYSNLQT